MGEDWQEFEKAVEQFLAALDAKASVTRDVKTPDRYTGQPRQRDVWIQARLLGHFPITALVSCKRWHEKLDVQDIDAFVGEWDSSGAHVGVIYSYGGYTNNALDKARALGISCCRLVSGQAPELPEALIIPSYCFQPRIGLFYDGGLSEPDDGPATWDRILDAAVAEGTNEETILDVVVEVFRRLEREALNKEELRASHYPPSLEARLTFSGPDDGGRTLKLRVQLLWACFRGDVSAYLYEGSYCETDTHFTGKQSFPIIDLHGAHPGPAWNEVPFPPAVGRSYMHCFRYGADVKTALESNLRGTALTPAGE